MAKPSELIHLPLFNTEFLKHKLSSLEDILGYIIKHLVDVPNTI